MVLVCVSPPPPQGAWGGSLLMSRKHRWKLDGVERQDLESQKTTRDACLKSKLLNQSSVFCDAFRANSVTWNPHKMMSVPLQCSALLVREEVLQPRRTPSPPRAPAPLLNRSGSLPAGPDAELQPDARLLPLPAGQALRPVLRHRRQGAAVRAPRGHLQAVAHVASKGGGL